MRKLFKNLFLFLQLLGGIPEHVGDPSNPWTHDTNTKSTVCPKKSCPFLDKQSLYTDGQDFFDIQHVWYYHIFRLRSYEIQLKFTTQILGPEYYYLFINGTNITWYYWKIYTPGIKMCFFPYLHTSLRRSLC